MPPAIAAVAIGSAISGGAALGAAKLQSNAAKKAAAEQQKGTDAALKVQQEQSAPYRALGQEGVNRLMQMGAPQPYTQQFRPGGGQPQGNGFQAFNPGQPQPTLGSIGQQGPPQAVPRGMGQPQMVNLRAPDGSVRPFPAQDAQRVMAQARAAGHELQMVN